MLDQQEVACSAEFLQNSKVSLNMDLQTECNSHVVMKCTAAGSLFHAVSGVSGVFRPV